MNKNNTIELPPPFRHGKYSEKDRSINLLAEQVRQLNTRLDQLQQQFVQATQTANDKQRIIAEQHRTLEQFQQDLLLKTQKPLIMELIGIADNLDMILNRQREQADYDSLLGAVAKLREWVNAVMADNSVVPFSEPPQAGQPIARGNRQRVTANLATHDPKLDNGYQSLKPGYVWTMPYLVATSETRLQDIIAQSAAPQGFTFVIRPEELACLHYTPEQESNNQ